MPQGNPKPGELYRHFKNKLYQIVAVAEHSETGERLVVYQALYGGFRTYVRPYDMFVSEVDHVKYPDVKQQFRFAYLKEDGEEEADAPEAADPGLIRFMDAESFSDKFEVFTQLRPVMTDKLLDEIAVVCDLVIPEGELSGRYEQLKKCLLTRMKYERERNWDR